MRYLYTYLSEEKATKGPTLDVSTRFMSSAWYLNADLGLNTFAVVFYNFYRSKGLAAPLNLVLIEFVIVLPLVGFIWMLQQRRNNCLDLLSEVKCGLLYIVRTFVSDCQDDMLHVAAGAQGDTGDNDVREHLHSMSRSISKILSGMHEYFLPSRFYSTRYPYLGYKSAMFQIALDRADMQKQIRRGLEDLDGFARDAKDHENKTEIRSMVYKLHVTIDKLCNVKEFGTPQGVRSMVRCYICIIIPLFFGPYWALISQSADFAVAFFVSLAYQIALTGLLNVAITLEDPFDNVGLCGIYIDEQLFEVESSLRHLGLLHVDGGSSHQEHEEEEDGEEGEADPVEEGVSTRQQVVRVATDNV